MIAGPIEGTVAILRELKEAGTALYALTNWSHETFPVALERFEFMSWFRGIVVSGQEKLIKPDPRIYQLLVDRHGLRPEDIVYIDDNPRNAAAAICALKLCNSRSSYVSGKWEVRASPTPAPNRAATAAPFRA